MIGRAMTFDGVLNDEGNMRVLWKAFGEGDP
jgi:hypothetical protein